MFLLWNNVAFVLSRNAGYMRMLQRVYSGFMALFPCPASLEFVQLESREYMCFRVENDVGEREVILWREEEV
jgi:hypothetical protein